MSQKTIRSLLEQRLATWAASKPLPVAWQNVAFTPPAGMYLRAFLLPAATDGLDLAGEHRTYAGIFQVTIVAAEGQGSAAAESLVGELESLFPQALLLTSGAVTVQVVTPVSAAPAIQDGSRYLLPASFRYRSDV